MDGFLCLIAEWKRRFEMYVVFRDGAVHTQHWRWLRAQVPTDSDYKCMPTYPGDLC